MAAPQLSDLVSQVGLARRSEESTTLADLHPAEETGEKERGARIAYTLVGRNAGAADHNALEGLGGVKVLVVKV